MDNKYPACAWKNLGKEAAARRGTLGYGYGKRELFLAERGGRMSSKMLARFERGEQHDYPDATVAALEALYQWEAGSFEKVLRGGEPVPLPGTPGGAPLDAGPPPPEIVTELWGTLDRSPQFIQDVWRGERPGFTHFTLEQKHALITTYVGTLPGVSYRNNSEERRGA